MPAFTTLIIEFSFYNIPGSILLRSGIHIIPDNGPYKCIPFSVT